MLYNLKHAGNFWQKQKFIQDFFGMKIENLIKLSHFYIDTIAIKKSHGTLQSHPNAIFTDDQKKMHLTNKFFAEFGSIQYQADIKTIVVHEM